MDQNMSCTFSVSHLKIFCSSCLSEVTWAIRIAIFICFHLLYEIHFRYVFSFPIFFHFPRHVLSISSGLSLSFLLSFLSSHLHKFPFKMMKSESCISRPLMFLPLLYV